MTDRFEATMAKRTDSELIKIVSVDRNDYQPLAVEAAEVEIRKRNLDTRFIEETIVQQEAEHRQKQLTDAGKQTRGIRVIHVLVDTFLYYVLGFTLAIAGMWVLPYTSGGEAETFELLIWTMILLSFFLYYVGMEFIFQRTVGKFITGTKVLMADGSKPDFGTVLKRTFCRFIPFDGISFMLMENGFHDSLSNTKVVNTKHQDAITSFANTPESSSHGF